MNFEILFRIQYKLKEMRSYLSLISLLIFFLQVQGQNIKATTTLNIGKEPPPIYISKWIKGKPVNAFTPGQIYVIEIWATWCKPCIEAMPKLTKISKKYIKEVTFIGVNCYEKDKNLASRIQSFVDSMGRKIRYSIAIQDSNLMETKWMQAAGNYTIPQCFVINQENQIAWIGHTDSLSEVLSQIVNKKWDMNAALNRRNNALRLERLEEESNEHLLPYLGEVFQQFKYGDPDSALFYINTLLSHEPSLKFSPSIAKHTFAALLRKNTDSAFEYGMDAIKRNHYEAIIDGIKNYYDPFNIPLKIYSLGAHAYEQMISDYPLVAGTPKNYLIMAEWYWKANDKHNAIRAQKKVVQLLRKSKVYELHEVY